MLRRTSTGLVALAALFFCAAAPSDMRSIVFAHPIDALSVGLGTRHTFSVTGWDGLQWTKPQVLERDDEQDPRLMESNLVIFPRPVSAIRIVGKDAVSAIPHPIRVSTAPAAPRMAAFASTRDFHIITRSEWGADDTLLYTAKAASSSGDVPADEGDKNGNGKDATENVPDKRVTDCQEDHKNYPDEFRIGRTVNTNREGKTYRWPLQYSPHVRVLVVHHTAIRVEGDDRPGVERMRALYEFHAKNRGWGDVGYHYAIDESGQIYEGRNGGRGVVGGHVYCHNVGTVGVALMGNFDEEKPTQEQVQALQWLLDILGKQYDIDLKRTVVFHGEGLSPIVGHRDLVSTDCPGYYVWNTLSQIRNHVSAGNLLATVNFPVKPVAASASSRKATAPTPLRTRSEGLSPIGEATLIGRPGGTMLLGLHFSAGSHEYMPNQRAATIERSSEDIVIWQDQRGTFTRLKSNLLLPEPVHRGGTLILRLKIQLPKEEGGYTLSFGDLTYILQVGGGRRARTVVPDRFRLPPMDSTVSSAPPQSRIVPARNPVRSPVVSSRRYTRLKETTSPRANILRLRITPMSPTPSAFTVTLDGPATVNGLQNTSRNFTFEKFGDDCRASADGSVIAGGIVRIDPDNGIGTVEKYAKKTKRLRGVLECRVIGDVLTLIDELPLEEYMRGLSEEPDSEPYEKQRAFAIAARTYAAFYMDPAHRKYPGMPYDGSDDPASFQAFGGVTFSSNNPGWLRAVANTAGQVLTKNNIVIKPPYFSSDDGRTRSPAELGGAWASIPFPEIFQSKKDPWCAGMPLNGHGVGMSGCGAKGQAKEGKTAEQILEYYYPGTEIRAVGQ